MKSMKSHVARLWKVLAIVVVAILIAVQGSDSAKAVAINSGNVTVFHNVSEQALSAQGSQFRFRQLASDSSRNPDMIEIAEITMQVGDEGLLFKKHVVNTDEDIYVESGALSCTVGQLDQVVPLAVGEIVHIPAGVPYGCKSLGPDTAKLFLISSSSALEDFMTEVAGITGNPSDVLNANGNRMDEMTEIAKKYGISFLN